MNQNTWSVRTLVRRNFACGGRSNIDLIVMGANRVSSARTAAHTPWAVAHSVICEAKCPVLTVRGES